MSRIVTLIALALATAAVAASVAGADTGTQARRQSTRSQSATCSAQGLTQARSVLDRRRLLPPDQSRTCYAMLEADPRHRPSIRSQSAT